MWLIEAYEARQMLIGLALTLRIIYSHYPTVGIDVVIVLSCIDLCGC